MPCLDSGSVTSSDSVVLCAGSHQLICTMLRSYLAERNQSPWWPQSVATSFESDKTAHMTGCGRSDSKLDPTFSGEALMLFRLTSKPMYSTFFCDESSLLQTFKEFIHKHIFPTHVSDDRNSPPVKDCINLLSKCTRIRKFISFTNLCA